MAKTYQTVKVNKFVKRQNSKSGKTYSIDLSFNEIALYAEKIINEQAAQVFVIKPMERCKCFFKWIYICLGKMSIFGYFGVIYHKNVIL